MKSVFNLLGPVTFPKTSDVRVQLMPVEMHRADSLPDNLSAWAECFSRLCSFVPAVTGIGYLTIDQRSVKRGISHRRPGLHVDGMGDWGGGGWAARGMIMASNIPLCAAYRQDFDGEPVTGKDCGDPNEGNCEHLRNQCLDSAKTIFLANRAYWCDAMCVHESLPADTDVYRTFVRLSMPGYSLWPRNCTPNPKVALPAEKVGVGRRIDGDYAYV